MMVFVDVKHHVYLLHFYSTVQEPLCDCRGGRPGLPILNSPYGLCGRKATLNRAQDLCENRGGRPGLP